MVTVILLLLLPFLLGAPITAQDDGYIGYNLEQRGDPESAVYETLNTPSNVSDYPPPDVFLNASVEVGEISIEVDNLTAKINLDAQVLQLLDFNAGVDASIEKVRLGIYDVVAKVHLEARLENLVLMISNVLDSIDINPLVATIGNAAGKLLNETGDIIENVGGGTDSASQPSALEERGFKQDENILYSVNDYTGNAHTNRILLQNGDLIDQSLNNKGDVSREKLVGSYKDHLHFTGESRDVVKNGRNLRVEEWIYKPFPGLEIITAVYLDAENGNVVRTRVIAEASAGGSSTISADDD